MRVTARPLLLVFLVPGLAGCDPVIDIDGSFFPAWMLCLIVGITAAVLIRQVFARTGLEPHLGPPLLIYSSLGLLCTFVTWLLLYRT